jgi:hypothetical protein
LRGERSFLEPVHKEPMKFKSAKNMAIIEEDKPNKDISEQIIVKNGALTNIVSNRDDLESNDKPTLSLRLDDDSEDHPYSVNFK